MSLLDSYQYEARAEWTGRRAGRVTVEDLPEISVSAPPEFAGDPGAWTPEHLLVAAAASCLMTTFLAIAELSRLHVDSFQCRAVARLEKIPGEGYRFTEITLVPEIGIAVESADRARKVLSKAEQSCFISRSLRATVRVEPHFAVATQMA